MLSKAPWLMALVLCVFLVPVQAGVIFTNINVDPMVNPYNPTEAHAIGTVGLATAHWAYAFMPATTVVLDRISLAVTWSAGPSMLDVQLTNDDSLNPGTVIETYIATGLTPYPGVDPLNDVSSLAHPTLTAGTLYWVIVTANDAATVAGWHWNTIGDTGLGRYQSGNGVWYATSDLRGAFTVHSLDSAVPEPASFLLVLVPVALIGLRRRLF